LDEKIRQKDAQIQELKIVNKQLSSFGSQLQAKSSIMETLKDENLELSIKLSELQGTQHSETALIRQNEDLATCLKSIQLENRKLSEVNQELNQQIGRLKDSEKEIQSLKKRIQQMESSNLSIIDQKDDMIRQLKATTVTLQEQVNLLQKNNEIEPILVNIERVLIEFPIESLSFHFEINLTNRLQRVLKLIYRIKNLIDDQKRIIDKLNVLTGAQQGLNLKSSRDQISSINST